RTGAGVRAGPLAPWATLRHDRRSRCRVGAAVVGLSPFRTQHVIISRRTIYVEVEGEGSARLPRRLALGKPVHLLRYLLDLLLGEMLARLPLARLPPGVPHQHRALPGDVAGVLGDIARVPHLRDATATR